MTYWADQATIRERQKAAHAVLAKLLDLDLPAANWELTSVYVADINRRPVLTGQFSDAHHETDEQRRASLGAWAAHFGVTPDPGSDGDFVHVRAVVDGIDVEMWAAMDEPRKQWMRERAAEGTS